jgi:hypothetical protein
MASSVRRTLTQALVPAIATVEKHARITFASGAFCKINISQGKWSRFIILFEA